MSELHWSGGIIKSLDPFPIIGESPKSCGQPVRPVSDWPILRGQIKTDTQLYPWTYLSILFIPWREKGALPQDSQPARWGGWDMCSLSR